MEGTIILGWYVLVETGSVLLLTLFASLNYTGTLLAPLFGVIGDRIGHRDLLAVMRASYIVLAATLLTLALTGHLNASYVLVIAALMGQVARRISACAARWSPPSCRRIN